MNSWQQGFSGLGKILIGGLWSKFLKYLNCLFIFSERRSLIFRTFQPQYPETNPNVMVDDPEDNGYNFKHSGHIRILINTMKDNGFR